MPAEPYPEVVPSPSFPELERRVIERWRAEGTFQASIDQRLAEGADEFVFYDGPPFANGPMHYGHLLTGFVKDAVPRYRTMRGQRVERRFGWDCHGLPVEMEAEKALDVTGRIAIQDYGVGRFNEYCRSIVGSTADEWHGNVQRQARWVDMVHDYKTMDLAYMESVMWAVKQLWDKGLLYEGVRVLPYCWECETPLSNFETRLDDAYRQRQDPALTVWFELETGERLLVWTTTPWTLPSNLALAVGPDVSYAVFDDAGHRYLLGEDTVGTYAKELDGAERVGTVLGRELVGKSYTPLFGFFSATPNAFRVLAADWVETEEGTGVVHLAPGFGEVDLATCEKAGIPVVCPVDHQGRFTSEVPDWAGQQVFDANGGIIRALKDAGNVVRHETIDHSYPHCWRTDTPLIYTAVSSWFVKVTAIRDRMLELNQRITWVPEHVRDGSFGKWLEGARDWSISRNRFWGSPIAVWKSDDPAYPRVDVYGSLDELERDFGVRPTDLHRPAIDDLTRPNPDDPTGRSTMRRIEDVLDCWFESGSMPFAQVHYPFENADWFESHFPGDFICEYIGQTRGWFYTLHVLATALFDRPAFETCLVHGVLLGDDGQKLSKRLRNYPDPGDVFDFIGSDAMRWSLLSSAAVRGGDMVADRRHMQEAVRQVLLPIWNAWYFLTLYARAEGVRGSTVTGTPEHVLDRYALAKARHLVDRVGARMDAYDLSGASAEIIAYLESLNNWYIRRSRDRFWSGDQGAVDSLHTVLEILCRVAAPLLPLLTDTIWPALTAGSSVHLAGWPSVDELPADDALVAAMDAVRDVCSAASSIRKAEGLRVRLPLASLTVASPDAGALTPFVDLIKDEVNVKDVVLTTAVGIERVLKLNPRVLGPRVGADVQKLIRAAKDADYEVDADGGVTVLGRRLEPDEFELALQEGGAGTRLVPGSSTVVTLDLQVTPELTAEGVARDVIRGINEARRTDGLDVTDRVRLVIDCGHHDDVRAAVRIHEAFVKAETLAVELVLPDDGHHHPNEAHRIELADGRAVHVAVTKTGGH